MDKTLVVSVVVPLHKAAAILEPFLDRLTAVLSQAYEFYEVILVDDGADEATGGEARRLLGKHQRIRFLRLSRFYGKEVAIAAGLETAIGDFVVTLDPWTDPVGMIPDLVRQCRSGSGILCGTSTHPAQESFFTGLAGSLFHRYCRTCLGLEYKQHATDFRVLSRRAVNAVNRIRDRRRYLKVFLAVLGNDQEFFAYAPVSPPRPADGFFQRIDHAFEIAIAHSRHPLRTTSRIGLLLGIVNLVYAFYVLLVYLLKRDVEAGWTTMSMQMTGMFFFLFLILAVLCEYVGRILEETQERPLYFVRSEETSSVLLEDSIGNNVLDKAS
jgi:dolichol-phosphate mannosyltransferase